MACDIYAPCALGGILNDKTIPELRCQAVAGCANNQLIDRATCRDVAKDGPSMRRLRHQCWGSHQCRLEISHKGTIHLTLAIW